MKLFLSIALVIFPTIFIFNGENFYSHTLWVEVISSIIFSLWIAEKTDYSVFFPLAISLTNAAFFSNFSFVFFKSFGPVVSANFSSLISGSAFYLIATVLSVFLISSKHTKYMKYSFVAIGLINACVKSKYLQNPASLDSCLIFLCMAFVFLDSEQNKIFRFLTLSVAIYSAISSGSRTVLLMGIVSALGYLISINKKNYLYALIGIIGFTCILIPFLHAPISFTSGRIAIWKLAMGYWWKDVNIFTGTGIGSFLVYGPSLQIQAEGPGHPMQFWIWLHNDWLQILFEGGILLFISSLYMYGRFLYLSFKAPQTFAIALSYGVLMIFQFPLRQAPLTLLGLLIAKQILDLPDPSKQSQEL